MIRKQDKTFEELLESQLKKDTTPKSSIMVEETQASEAVAPVPTQATEDLTTTPVKRDT